MLVKQTGLYFFANISSAVFGVLNVVIFTHFFAAEAFGDYTLGLSFAAFLAVFLSSSVKLVVLRDQARGDGTDVRGTALAALILCCAAAPFGYLAARLVNLSPAIAIASTVLTMAVIIFETSLELLRAEQQATRFVAGTMARALLVSALGCAVAVFGGAGVHLLIATAVGYALATLSLWRPTWGRTKPQFDWSRLRTLFRTGAPMTIALSLLALSGMIDRFLLANLVGRGAAGQYGASLDIVRQGLAMPAISIAAAFIPASVQLLATKGEAQARLHLEKYLELLLAVSLPACVGFAIVAPLVSDLVLGPNFRVISHQAMPVFAAALLFQVLTQQYLSTSFLLANRIAFYLVNTGSVIVWNVVTTYLLVTHFGVIGAVWGRLATEIFAFACALLLSFFAFPMPFRLLPIVRIAGATAAMGLVAWLLMIATARYGRLSLVMIVPASVAAYGAATWWLDIVDLRAVLSRFTASRLGSRPDGWFPSGENNPAVMKGAVALANRKNSAREASPGRERASTRSEGAGI